MVLGVSTGIEPIFAPIYKRRWRTGTENVCNENIVIDALFKDLYLRGRDVSHCVGAYDVTPEEHIKVQTVVQTYIDSAVSKTCNLPHDFQAKDLYDDLLTYVSDMKGFTFYRAGSRGSEPLEAVDISSIDLDKLIREGSIEEASDSLEVCKSGVCEV